MNASILPLCLDGTRQDVLQEIWDWVADNKSKKNILWLHGFAGSGKTTVAATVSARHHLQAQRGAFLFFQRGRAGQDSVIHTMASQLAHSTRILRLEISVAIEMDPRIVEADFDSQLKYLLLNPLTSAANVIQDGPIVIVIDGLDEYGNESQRRSLLTLITTKFVDLPKCFRFLITSRPESDIHAKFSNCQMIKSLALVAGEASITDIRTYLSLEMTHIREMRGISNSLWPGESELNDLAKMSEGLFIWAFTLSRFLGETMYPEQRLTKLFASKGKDITGVDRLYATILSTVITTDDWKEFAGRFRAAVGVALFSTIPLTDTTIDGLLDLQQDDSCGRLFRSLRSLFDYEPGWPIRSLHASFRDYLVDPSRSGNEDWTLVNFDAHQHLTALSLRIMENQLRFNICDFKSSDDVKRDCPESKQKISHALKYACQYWVNHLVAIDDGALSSNLEQSLESFLKHKLLSWAEVLSLTGTIEKVISKFDKIRKVPFVRALYMILSV